MFVAFSMFNCKSNNQQKKYIINNNFRRFSDQVYRVMNEEICTEKSLKISHAVKMNERNSTKDFAQRECLRSLPFQTVFARIAVDAFCTSHNLARRLFISVIRLTWVHSRKFGALTVRYFIYELSTFYLDDKTREKHIKITLTRRVSIDIRSVFLLLNNIQRNIVI